MKGHNNSSKNWGKNASNLMERARVAAARLGDIRVWDSNDPPGTIPYATGSESDFSDEQTNDNTEVASGYNNHQMTKTKGKRTKKGQGNSTRVDSIAKAIDNDISKYFDSMGETHDVESLFAPNEQMNVATASNLNRQDEQEQATGNLAPARRTIRPRPPRASAPGAIAVGDEDSATYLFTASTGDGGDSRRDPLEPVEAEIVHSTDENYERLQEELQRMRAERENAVIAQVVPDNRLANYFCSCSRKKKIALALATFVIIGLVVGLAVFSSSKSPKQVTGPIVGDTADPPTDDVVTATVPPALDTTTPDPDTTTTESPNQSTGTQSENNVTTTAFAVNETKCFSAMNEADEDANSMLNRTEYTSFVGILTSNFFLQESFTALPQTMRSNYRQWKSEDTNQINIYGAKEEEDADSIQSEFLLMVCNETLEVARSRSATTTSSESTTLAPSLLPEPSAAETSQPVLLPTRKPTSPPNDTTTRTPTRSPRTTQQPMRRPTARPTGRPNLEPTLTLSPTRRPTLFPTRRPTPFPTKRPTLSPTPQPTRLPTSWPTSRPTIRPTSSPTRRPTLFPTQRPTIQPTLFPTRQPTLFPTGPPTRLPVSPPAPLAQISWSNLYCLFSDCLESSYDLQRNACYNHAPHLFLWHIKAIGNYVENQRVDVQHYYITTREGVCVTEFHAFGLAEYMLPFDYDINGAEEDAFVVKGTGEAAPTTVETVGSNVVFKFSPALCSFQGGDTSSAEFGVALRSPASTQYIYGYSYLVRIILADGSYEDMTVCEYSAAP